MKTTDLARVRATLWAAADELRANSKLTPGQYRDPVLGLVFLAYAESRFEAVRGEVEAGASARNPVTIADYKAKSVLYVPDEARLSSLVDLPEGEDVGKATDQAIKSIEEANPELKDILPRGYQKLERSTLIELLRLFAPLPTQLEGDAFGFIYEDFLSNFAAQEGRGAESTSRRTPSSASSLRS
ncbi:membrane protein (plasmid) [Sinomonas atrocyanea]|uniref:Membrane protein n=1 Tax=Sinomonas atrocyanea TaxID=37927 RepID=A0A127A5M3_9MICC|nr:membrane protein [Sinomonas atrocyanea]